MCDARVALLVLSIYYTWSKIENSYKKNNFKISGPIWDEEFESPNSSYSTSDIQNYFEYIIKKYETDRQSTNTNICQQNLKSNYIQG